MDFTALQVHNFSRKFGAALLGYGNGKGADLLFLQRPSLCQDIFTNQAQVKNDLFVRLKLCAGLKQHFTGEFGKDRGHKRLNGFRQGRKINFYFSFQAFLCHAAF